jgi:hypothetical protein
MRHVRWRAGAVVDDIGEAVVAVPCVASGWFDGAWLPASIGSCSSPLSEDGIVHETTLVLKQMQAWLFGARKLTHGWQRMALRVDESDSAAS